MSSKHPITNYPLLEGGNYRTWSAAMKRLLDAQGQYLIVDNTVSDSDVEPVILAKIVNMLSEHCVPEIQDVFFIEDSSPRVIWAKLFNKFGPSNTMLGETAKTRLSRQRWQVGEDPGKFLNGIDSLISEIKYYGLSIGNEKLIELFPKLIPSDGEWSDFEKSMMNVISLTWDGLKTMFTRRANYANSRIDSKIGNSIFAVSNVPKSPWTENQELVSKLEQLSSEYGLAICLKCRRIGHLTRNHVDNNFTRKKKSPSEAVPDKVSTAAQSNSVRMAEQELSKLLFPNN